ncbi:unnamed protein product [Discula destructiva]
MAPPTPSILALKHNFLTAQTRLLSQPLQPSRAWRRSNEAAGEDAHNKRVSEKAVDDALFRLNQTLQQHAKRVYPPQATRQVIEQIDALYLATGERRVDGADEADDETWRLVGADFVRPEVANSLPETWESEREATAQPLEAKRYAELVERLQGLSARKKETEMRVKRLRKIKAQLEPFNSKDSAGPDAADEGSSYAPVNGVQENLVQRGGELEKELERMRMLLVRVGDKIARLKEREGSDDDLFGDGDVDAMAVDDVEMGERRKVDALVERMR